MKHARTQIIIGALIGLFIISCWCGRRIVTLEVQMQTAARQIERLHGLVDTNRLDIMHSKMDMENMNDNLKATWAGMAAVHGEELDR